MGLPTDDKARKALPIFTGFLMYFPDVPGAVAAVSKAGNDQHNPGEPLHWAREKSTDQMNTAMRHMMDHGVGNTKDTDGTYHLAKAIWRLSAELQLTIEREALQPITDVPRRCIGTEQVCQSQAHVIGSNWNCERPAGHSGNHMAWTDYERRILYTGGQWK